MANKLLVVIGGPTGVGKTDTAIQLARHYHSEIIIADSRQVYEELRIGVGRPSTAQLQAIPHHLLGYTSIHQPYSVARYVDDVLNLLQLLFEKHNVVFLTGGTGLYVRAIMEGLDSIPEIPHEITDKWTALWQSAGTPALVEKLETLDPEYASVVDRANPRRLIRALAVSEFTGLPYSSFRKGVPVVRPFDILPLVLEIPRDELYARINQRVEDMLEEGWLDEAKTLFPFKGLKALQTVGYTELFSFMEGQISWPECIHAIQQSTRRYAKRQLTWWRHQGAWQAFHPHAIDELIQTIDEKLVSK